MASQPTQSRFVPEEDTLLHEPPKKKMTHKERWEHLKPIIIDLYTGNHGQNGNAKTIDEVVVIMKNRHAFHAAPSEYRRHFREWNVGKRIVEDEKHDVVNALARRKRLSTTSSPITIIRDGEERPFEAKKLKRYVKSQQKPAPILTIPPGLLSSWHLPYAAFASSLPRDPSKPSPYGPLGATPEYVHIHSPAAISPGQDAAAPTPNMQLVYEKAKHDRASLFMQGRLEELVISMCGDDRRLMVDYFHDFYMYSLSLAMRWGIAPHSRVIPAPLSPTLISFSPFSHASPGSSQMSRSPNVPAPTQLCRWAVHVPEDQVYGIEASPPTSSENSNAGPSLQEKMRQAMLSDSFSSTPAVLLPLFTETIVQSLESDQSSLDLDAWKLAIMCGNTELLFNLALSAKGRRPEGIDTIQPFHLAAAFLDGGKSCCMVFRLLSSALGQDYAFHHNVDNLGHTIFDTLMVSILRSHTCVGPETVSRAFNSPRRFPGEESDLCGRWDALDPAIRQLFRHGHAQVPARWKHPFCHTSVQAICHSMIAIFGSPASPNINCLSGIFLRRCTACGLELRLGPLHAFVVTAFYLAQMGMDGETLFGAISVMICLLTLGANVNLKVNVSAEEILGNSDEGRCLHNPLSALEFMQAVPNSVVKGWTEDCQIGWACLEQILSLAEHQLVESHGGCQNSSASSNPAGEFDASDDETSSATSSSDARCVLKEEIHETWMMLPCIEPRIGKIWALAQTEFLTYRRLREGDPWISGNFSMRAVRAWLQGDADNLLMPLTEQNMVKDHSPCGWFHRSFDLLGPNASEVSQTHFMNMDVYERTSFIQPANFSELWDDIEIPDSDP